MGNPVAVNQQVENPNAAPAASMEWSTLQRVGADLLTVDEIGSCHDLQISTDAGGNGMHLPFGLLGEEVHHCAHPLTTRIQRGDDPFAFVRTPRSFE